MAQRKKQLLWEEWLTLAADYAAQYGDLRIPHDYITPCGNKLGRWIERQRTAYKGKGSYKMTADRIAALENLGMEWALEIRTKWDVCYIYAAAYYTDHQHLRIPCDYKTDNGIRLGEWIKQQRKKYRLGMLSEKQISLLGRIGMEWLLVKRPPWNEWYGMAQAYHTRYGTIQIPTNYITGDGYRLGMWLSCQRSKYKNEPAALTKKQIQALEQLGIVWNVGETRWRHMYELAKSYYHTYGNLGITQKYIAPSGDRLGQWLSLQRQAYNHQLRSPLSQERIDLLNHIGMKW